MNFRSPDILNLNSPDLENNCVLHPPVNFSAIEGIYFAKIGQENFLFKWDYNHVDINENDRQK